MLPLIITLLVIAAIVLVGQKVISDRRKHGGRDYMDYFKENEKRR